MSYNVHHLQGTGECGAASTPSSGCSSPLRIQPACCHVTVDVGEARTTVSLAGEFDLSAVVVVTEAVMPHLDRAVTVDLDAVTFFDSSGMQCLLQLSLDATARGGSLSLGSMSRPVRRVLEIAGLADRSLGR